MTESTQTMAILALYRIFTISCSLVLILWGYRLLRRAADGASAVRHKFPQATGMLLAVLGAALFAVSVWRGIEGAGSSASQEAAPAELGDVGRAERPAPAARSGDVQVPAEIRTLLDRAASGETLTEPDRKRLREWASGTGGEHGGHGQQASEAPKRTTRHIPVPAPGEI